jgi:hypothetical protein
MALSWTLDKLGPMCRSAEDCGLVLETIAGNDSEDPGSAGRNFRYTPQFARKPHELRVGYAPADFNEWADEDIRPELARGLEVIRSLGVQLKEVELPDFPYGALVSTILAGEAGSIFEEFIKSGRVDELADQRQIAGLKSYVELPSTISSWTWTCCSPRPVSTSRAPSSSPWMAVAAPVLPPAPEAWPGLSRLGILRDCLPCACLAGSRTAFPSLSH